MRTVWLQGADNVRDLGGIPICGNRVVTQGLFFRGSALAGITPDDQHVLFGQLGIARIIDLRCGWERDAKPDVIVPGVENLHTPFYDLEIVGIEYTEPAEGTKVVGRDVACDPERFYRSLANPLTVGQMRKALQQVFECALQGRPVYVHCGGGKDRAGVMALLVLTALGAEPADTLEDYLLTNIARDKKYDQMYERFFGFCHDDQRARELVEAHRARPENLQAFYEAVEHRYGNMGAFMAEQLGIDDVQRALIRSRCTQPALHDEPLLVTTRSTPRRASA